MQLKNEKVDNSFSYIKSPLDYLPSQRELKLLVTQNAALYREANPYPHICVDSFLPLEAANELSNSFPASNNNFWKAFNNEQEKKSATSAEENIPAVILNTLYALNGQTFLRFLEELTGINALLPDPYFIGGGMHNIPPGGKLGVHLDFNRYKRFNLNRRLNLLIYLNQNWKEDYGGHLELWNTQGTECVKRLLPIHNRCVIFSTSENSYHGHPHPLTCPQGRSRNSIALYYYTNDDSSKISVYAHSTVFISKINFLQRASKLFRSVVRGSLPPFIYSASKFVVDNVARLVKK